jgi:hypothetical protein
MNQLAARQSPPRRRAYEQERLSQGKAEQSNTASLRYGTAVRSMSTHESRQGRAVPC